MNWALCWPDWEVSWSTKFTKKENFTYCGPTPADEYYLTFGQKNLDEETKTYLAERRSSGKPWNFATEMYNYNCLDVRILRQSVERFMEQNFSFQKMLIERFSEVHPKNKLSHLHCFFPTICDIGQF